MKYKKMSFTKLLLLLFFFKIGEIHCKEPYFFKKGAFSFEQRGGK